jgi:hypothetical protein
MSLTMCDGESPAWKAYLSCKFVKMFMNLNYNIESKLKNSVFWYVVPCGFIINRHFGGTCRLHLQGRRNTASEETCQMAANRLTTVWRAMKALNENLGRGEVGCGSE